MRRPVFSWYDAGGDDVRVGHAERDTAATRLGEHLTAGRLEWDEYDERLTAAYAARTRSDLARLFTDLPDGLPPAAAGTDGGHRPRTGATAVAVTVLALLARSAWIILAIVFTVVFRIVALALMATCAGGCGPWRQHSRHATWSRPPFWRTPWTRSPIGFPR